MSIKFGYIILLVVVLSGLYSCGPGKKIQQQAIKDIHGFPISFVAKDKTVIYFLEKGGKITGYFGGVEFEGGKDSLSKYLLTRYVNHPDYNHDEYNVYERFFILFDKDLDIKEIRIMHRLYENDKRSYYDSIFINALKSTSGMWNKTIENQEWYIYLHNQRIY